MVLDGDSSITGLTFGDDSDDDAGDDVTGERPVVEIDNVGVFVNESLDEEDIGELSDRILVRVFISHPSRVASLFNH